MDRLCIVELWNTRCAYCNEPWIQGIDHIDHITPIAAGGTTTLDNLAPACDTCNTAKGPNPTYPGADRVAAQARERARLLHDPDHQAQLNPQLLTGPIVRAALASAPGGDDPTADLGGFVPVSGDADSISWAEFVALGYLQELNRRFLIPLGLALEVLVGPGDEAVGVRLRGGWDPPAGPVLEPESIEVAVRALFVERAWQSRAGVRVRAHGWMVQPVPEVSVEMFDRAFDELGGASIDVADDREARTDG